jgi:hypothetical protein
MTKYKMYAQCARDRSKWVVLEYADPKEAALTQRAYELNGYLVTVEAQQEAQCRYCGRKFGVSTFGCEC